MKHTTLTVNINDVITPFGCYNMVIELIKYIAYQKELLPYPYQRLKLCINKLNEYNNANQSEINTNKNSGNGGKSLSSKYFKVIQEAHDSLETIFMLIKDEMINCSYNRIDEIILLLGTTIINPHDVFRIQIPPLNSTHSIQFHPYRRNQQCLIESIFASEEFYESVRSDSCKSNMFVLFKMKPDVTVRSPLFIPRHDFKLPVKGNHTIISFNSSTENDNNCSCVGVHVYQDDELPHSSNTNTEHTYKTCQTKRPLLDSFVSDHLISQWYQVKNPLRYFQDVKISGISLSDIAVNPGLKNDL